MDKPPLAPLALRDREDSPRVNRSNDTSPRTDTTPPVSPLKRLLRMFSLAKEKPATEPTFITGVALSSLQNQPPPPPPPASPTPGCQRQASAPIPVPGDSVYLEKDGRYSFESIEPIGEGAYGRVFLALDMQTQGIPRVAIKIFTSKNCRNVESMQKHARKEMMALMILDKGHPSIGRLVDSYYVKDRQRFVFEYCEISLLDFLREQATRGCKFQEPHVKIVMRQVFGALEYAHRRGVTHLDVKAENVMFLRHPARGGSDSSGSELALVGAGELPSDTRVRDDRLEVRLIDWGYAEVNLEYAFIGNRRTVSPMGSPHYMPPEKFITEGEMQPYDPEKADAWAAGVLLYASLSYSLPWCKPNGDDHFNLRNAIYKPLSDATTSGLAKHLVAQLLCRDPADRYTMRAALAHKWFTGGSGGA